MINKRLLKLFITILAVLNTVCLLSSQPVLADAETETIYGITISDIKDEVTKRYVQSLYLQPEGNAYRLIVNNQSVGSVVGSGTLKYYPNTSVTIAFNIDIPNQKITFTSTQVKVESIDCELDFSATNFDGPNYQTLVIRPNKSSGTSVTLTAKLNDNGWFYFDSYTYTYKGVGKTFEISLNSANGKVYNGDTCVGSLGSDNKVKVKLWYEVAINEDDAISMDYLENFTNHDFKTASTRSPRLYSTSEIETAFANYTKNNRLTLHNNATKDVIDFKLTEFIYTRPRLNEGASMGDGVYGELDGGKFQTICQWNEDACKTVREKFGESGRLYAVVGKTYTFRQPTLVTGPAKTSNAVKYTDETSYYQEPKGDDIPQYSYANVIYPDEYTWTFTEWPNYAITNTVKTDTRTKYAIRTRSWYDWTGYIYSSGKANTIEQEWEGKTFYSKSTRGWQAWSKWSEDNKCSVFDLSSECKDESRVRYDTKYATWSNWSSWSNYAYNLLGCTSTTSKECRSTTAYSYRKVDDWTNNWTDWDYTSCTNDTEGVNNTVMVGCQWRKEYRKQTRPYKYKQCNAEACGVDSVTYNSCRNSACGVESTTYKSCRNSSCGVESTTYKSCANAACGYKTCNVKIKQTQLFCKITCKGSCNGTTCIWYENKESSVCGNESCRTSACGVESTTYKSCRTSACGVESTTYKSCRTSACGIAYKTYKSCRTSACGEEDWSSWSSWDTTACSSSDLVNCDTRTRYRKRTRGWGSYGSYTTDATNANNSNYDYKTQTWYSSRTREYVWHDYTGNYTLESCSLTDTSSTVPIRYCKSQTQYHRAYMSDWSSYGDYTISATDAEYTNCINNYQTCKMNNTTKYRMRSRKAWTDWSDYIYSSCTPSTSGDVLRQCNDKTQYGYKVGTVGKWSEFKTNDTKSSFGISKDVQYKYRLMQKTTETINMTYYDTTPTKIGNKKEMTQSDIYNFRDQLNRAYAISQTENDAAKAYNELYQLSAAKWNEWASLNQSTVREKESSNSADGQNFINAKIFVPYLYIRAHIRAEYKETNVTAYNTSEDYTWDAKYPSKSDPDGPHPLIPEEKAIKRDSKVIYFDYHDPLANYEGEIPEDLEGLDAVIETIKNTNLEDKKMTMTISSKDIKAMKEWLENNDYNTGKNCAMLKEFAYIFDTKTQSLIESESCDVK